MPFSQEVTDQIDNYVYRLIDPRNGQTFYVGRGQGNRVFDHANGELNIGDPQDNMKFKIIRKIRADGLKVQHIIHRHGMSIEIAEEVEAALIDAYPGLTNKQGGKDSKKRGVMHADQIQFNYTAEEADFSENLLLVSINNTHEEKGPYEAARASWRVTIDNAKKCKYVLAVKHNVIREVFEVEGWYPVTKKHFPYHEENKKKKGFIGQPASEAVRGRYINKRVPTGSEVGQLGFRYYWHKQ